MHIALLTRGGRWWLGGGQYIKNIVQALNSLPAETRKTLRITAMVTAGSDFSSFQDLAGQVDNLVDGEAVMQPYNLPNRLRWKAKRVFGNSVVPRLEEFLRSEQVNFAYPCRPFKGRCNGLRFADWIPDFQYDYYPEGSNPEEIAGRQAEWKEVTENVPLIVLSSGVAEQDCWRLFPASRGKTFVLRFRVKLPTEHLQKDAAPVLAEYNLPERFFLVSNLFAPTKNHLGIFQALKLLKAEGICPTVVCTGDLHDYRNPEFAGVILRAINQSGVAEQVRLLGIIPRWQQVQLMRHAVAVLQPSLFEGWNTSVEEAHCLGQTLILSDIPVHREQNPPGAIFFDPQTPEDLARAMKTVWQEKSGGIDLEGEARALANYQQLIEEFGRVFLSLATKQ